jgi:hypothetical protein
MLLINVPAATYGHINFALFMNFGLPEPVGGVDAEINNDLILKFEDEEEAVIYAAQLENLSIGLKDQNSPEDLAIGDIIMAIRNDDFVQSYLEKN